MPSDLKPRSHEVTDGPERAPARAMLRAVGMTDADWDKPQVGVASSWNEVTPCNLSLDRLAKRAKQGVRDAGGFPLEFVTIAVSDGISMGTEGMRASLVSREIIADSVEAMMHAERFDALVTLAGCDKSLPGMLMAAARVNLPSVFLYGGTITARTGRSRRGARHCQRLRGGRGQGGGQAHGRGTFPHRAPGLPHGGQLRRHVHGQHDGVGGRSPGDGASRQLDAPRQSTGGATTTPTSRARAVVKLLEAGIRPRQIMTKEAFENAIAVVMALGGSTNAVLHSARHRPRGAGRALARRLRPDRQSVPHIADMKPHGRFHMVDLDRIGGLPVVMKAATGCRAAARRLPDRHGPHAWPRTWPRSTRLPPTARSSVNCRRPLHADGGLAILRGSLAPAGAVVKVAGLDFERFEGTARVFDGEQAALEAILAGSIQPGSVVVIRYEGPRAARA